MPPDTETQIPASMKYLIAGVHWIILNDNFNEGAGQLLKALREMEKVGPTTYIWGVEAEDLKSLPALWENAEGNTLEQLFRVLEVLQRWHFKAEQKLLVRMAPFHAKQQRWNEESRRFGDRLDSLIKERSQLRKETSPEAYRLVEKEISELCEKQGLLVAEQSSDHAELQKIFRDKQNLRESKEKLNEFLLRKSGNKLRIF